MAKGLAGKSISFLTLLALLFSTIMMIGCISTKQTQMNSGSISDIVNGNNRFALDMYSEIGDKQNNAFFSPWSIYSALAMVYEGAGGKTSDEMQSVMHFPMNNSTRRQSFASLYSKFNANDSDYTLSNANALWVQKEYPLLREYTAVVDEYYHGEVKNVDFIKASDEGLKTINSWVEVNTHNKIKGLMSSGSIDADTRLLLTNAIYFKGTWAKEFDKNATREEQFRTNDGRTVQVPMMILEWLNKFNYTETDNAQILEMPYKGNNISMLILLPKDDLSSLEKTLSPGKIAEWKNSLSEEKVEIHIPKFTINTRYPLAKNLGDLGMPMAFSLGADFSGIDGNKEIFLNQVIHQAFVDVDEKGTEATAATAAPATASKNPVFLADHPFIFIIQDKETGLIMFMGRVSDPSKK